MITLVDIANKFKNNDLVITKNDAIDAWTIDPNIFSIECSSETWKNDALRVKGLGELQIIE